MTGIAAQNNNIIRPLLCLSRKDILEYLKDRGLKYVDDSTNNEDLYTRNKIRLNIIPLLETINPSVKDSIIRTGEHLSQVESIYNFYIQQVKADVLSDDSINIRTLIRSFLAGHGVDGIVLAASDVVPNAGLLQELDIPFVSMDRDVPTLDCLAATVDTDCRSGAFASASYLIRKGHERIAFLSGSAASSNTRNRLAGFEEAHRRAGRAVDPVLVRCGEFQHSFGRQATLALLDSTRFSAICCMSDMLAIGATVALRERGLRVPHDCAVMGFDNIYLAPLLDRPLSTIDRRIFESGRVAIDALVDFLEGPDRKRSAILLETSVVGRETA